MKSALFLNFKRYGDIFSTGKLISSVKSEYPYCKIGIVVFKEFERAAELLKDVDHIYTIDRKKVVAIKKNDIFSNHHSLELLYESFEEISKEKWDNVVNYSHDLFSATLASYLTSTRGKHIGVKINEKNAPNLSSIWAKVQNEVSTTRDITPINNSTCLHRELGLVDIIGPVNCLNLKKEHEQVAQSNIEFLRKNESAHGRPVKIIGLQLKASNESKEIPFNTIKELINIILDSPNYFPVLLIAPTKEERNAVKNLNYEFDNKLISIEADFYAAASVLKNLDALITPCTSIKHLADLVNLPLVEVSLGDSPLFKQHTTKLDNIIISPSPVKRTFNQKCEADQYITANDIFVALNLLFNPSIITNIKFSPGLSVYKIKCDSLGAYPKFLAGDISIKAELSRYLSRHYIKTLETNVFEIDEIWENISEYPADILNKWIKEEYNQATLLAKDLLQGLRAIHSIKNGGRDTESFVTALDTIFKYGEIYSTTSIPALLFRGELEGLDSSNFSQNLSEVEKLFFTLKGNIQNLISYIKEFEGKINIPEQSVQNKYLEKVM